MSDFRTHNRCEPADSNALARDRGRPTGWTPELLAAAERRAEETRRTEAERRERLTRRYGGREIGTWDGEHTREYDTPAAAAEAARLYRGRVICGGRDTRVAYRV
jgi:hypothetical protein